MKPFATMVPCPGVINEGVYGHYMRDGCSSCAPYWEQYPTCPTHQLKLKPTGWCSACKKFYAKPEPLNMEEWKVVRR